MKLILKTILCDVAIPSLEQSLQSLFENNILTLILLLVLQLVVATIITVIIVSRKKNRDNNDNYADSNIEEENQWKD